MTAYDVLDEATIAATPAEIVQALLDEAAGRRQWWQPSLRMRQRGDRPPTEIGAVVDINIHRRSAPTQPVMPPAARIVTAADHGCGSWPPLRRALWWRAATGPAWPVVLRVRDPLHAAAGLLSAGGHRPP